MNIPSVTTKVDCTAFDIYVTVLFDGTKPIGILPKISKVGSDLQAMFSAVSFGVSKALQNGAEWSELAEHFVTQEYGQAYGNHRTLLAAFVEAVNKSIAYRASRI